MRDIASLNVRQTRLYEPDIIPVSFARTKLGIDFLMAQYQFREYLVAEGGEVLFSGGTLHVGDSAAGPTIPIKVAAIHERRIIVEVAGPSDWADLVFDSLRAHIASMDLERKLNTRDPLVMVSETQCLVTMDFSWQDMLAEPLVQFLSGPAVHAMGSAIATPRLSSINLSFTVSFTSSDSRLVGSGITLSDKAFTVEPRSNTPLEDQRFYTGSPLDSAAHLELLAGFEQAILARRGKRRKSLPPAT